MCCEFVAPIGACLSTYIVCTGRLVCEQPQVDDVPHAPTSSLCGGIGIVRFQSCEESFPNDVSQLAGMEI